MLLKIPTLYLLLEIFFFVQLLITVQFLRRFDNLKIHYEGFRTTLAI